MWLLIKNSLIRIKNTIGRFLSLFAIIALGLGFFAGVRSTSKDMILTADKYYDDKKLFDYKVVSTFGLNDDDINSLKELDEVEKVIPTYSIDTVVGSNAYRVHALEKNINTPLLKKGKMPKKDNECLAEFGKHKINDIINIKDDNLVNQSYKVVGLIYSPLYVGIEKGISSVGNGKLNSFIFVPKTNFKMDYYTEAYLISKDSIDEVSYGDKYDKSIKPLYDNLKGLKPIRETLRYEEILEDAIKEINKNELKIAKEEKDNRRLLNDAKTKIKNAKSEITNGKNKLEEAKNKLLDEKSTNEKRINEQEQLILDSEKKYFEQKKFYDDNKDKINIEISKGKEQLILLEKQINNLKEQINLLKQNDSTNPQIPILEGKLIELEKTYENSSNELDKKEQEFLNGPLQLEEASKKIQEGKLQIDNARKELNTKITAAEAKIKVSEAELLKNESNLKLEEAKLNSSIIEFENKINDAYKKIDAEKKKLNDIPKPVWYLLDRTDQTGYSDFKNDALRVDNIAKVFPVFFLLVAALVCLNTMTRMVEEDRNEIGIYKALGYSNFYIIFNYFMYVIIATLIGGGVGLVLGYNIFPRAIFSIYKVTYNLPALSVGVNLVNIIVVLSIALILTLSVTLYSCHKELKEVPASLLRPKAPKNGKKVLLEYIPFIWKRLNFSNKVTIRNLFRYKKRIFMTIIGIAGCTALTLTGFGLKDGISSIIPIQYNKLFKYDLLAVLNTDKNTSHDQLDKILLENNLVNPLYVSQDLYNFKTIDKQHDFFLVVPEDEKELYKYVTLRDRITKDKKKLSNNGAIITEKMADLLDVKVGDNIRIRNSDNKLFIIKVADIVENYTYHYVYMTKEYYEKVMETKPKYNMVYTDIKNDKMSNDKISTNLIASKEFLNTSFTSDLIETYSIMITSLNKIVLVILISSCALAFIVLYNLTNINIIERKRELATLKVLGFYDKEVSEYVYRETVILTILGILVGLLMGVFLHRFVMNTAEMDFMMFLKDIKPLSYLYAILFTFLFLIIVSIFTHFKLKHIDMIDSLKSVE